MSTASKLALGASVAFSISIITYVHYKQRVDREKLHEGVVRDLERQQKSKIQNLKMLQDQIELTKVLKAQRDADMEEKMKKANHVGSPGKHKMNLVSPKVRKKSDLDNNNI